jgi:hypothetical protein
LSVAVDVTAWMTSPPPAAMANVTIPFACALLPGPGTIAQAGEETGAVAGFCDLFERAVPVAAPRRARDAGPRRGGPDRSGGDVR